MDNSIFEARPRKGTSLSDLLENPVFSNVVRLFIIVILGLAGTIWKSEIGHLNKSLEDIKGSVNEDIRRQWDEVGQLRREVSQVNREVGQILLRTNKMLYKILDGLAAGKPLRSSDPAGKIARP